MKQKLLDILACPKCKSALEYDKKSQTLFCVIDNIGYAIEDGIPVLIDSDITHACKVENEQKNL